MYYYPLKIRVCRIIPVLVCRIVILNPPQVLSFLPSFYVVSNHFPEVRKMVEIGSGARRSQIDCELTRYACYLIVQNGDPRKEIPFCRRYFF